MARPPRFCPPGYPVHVIQRGNNRQDCFASEQDIRAYVHWLHEGAQKYAVRIHGWVIMTNHVHLLVTPDDHNGISKLMQHVGRSYVRRFNHIHDRTGTLFEGRFRSCLIQTERYLLNCLRYIELNPLRAGLVDDPANYSWSSYRAHAQGLNIEMQTPHAAYLALGDCPRSRQANYRALIKDALTAETIAKIRHCANKGIALGSQNFRDQIDHLRSYSDPVI